MESDMPVFVNQYRTRQTVVSVVEAEKPSLSHESQAARTNKEKSRRIESVWVTATTREKE